MDETPDAAHTGEQNYLVQGSIPEQKALDSRIYFDQNGVLCQRLGIDQVPAWVSAVPRRSLPEGGNLFPAEEGRKWKL